MYKGDPTSEVASFKWLANVSQVPSASAQETAVVRLVVFLQSSLIRGPTE